MIWAMAYSRMDTGALLSAEVRKLLGSHDLKVKEVFTSDKSHVSKMLHGQSPLDLNELWDELSDDLFNRLLARLLFLRSQRKHELKKEVA